MKKNAGKMLALLLTGFLVLNGCGESDQTQEAEETEETSEENTGENTEETTSGETTEDNATDAATDETTEGNPDDAAPEETAENTTAATAQGASGTDNTEAAAESGTEENPRWDYYRCNERFRFHPDPRRHFLLYDYPGNRRFRQFRLYYHWADCYLYLCGNIG